MAFVSTPFRFEGEKRCATARGECLEELEIVFNEVFVQGNEDLDDSLNLSDMAAKLCQEYARRFQ